MNTEREQLLNDLSGDETRDKTVLAAGGRILRRRRRWRAARRVLAPALVLAALVPLWLARQKAESPQVQAALPKAEEKSAPPMKSLTDDELLALFPDTPVGLATLPDGRKLLIFPRPEDERKFVARF